MCECVCEREREGEREREMSDVEMNGEYWGGKRYRERQRQSL